MANRSASEVREPDVYRQSSPVEQVAVPGAEQVTFTVAAPTPAPELAATQRERVPADPVPVHVMPIALAVGNVTTILGATALAAFGVAGLVTGGALAVGAAGAVAAARSQRGRNALAKTWGRTKASPLGSALSGRGRSGLGSGSKLGSLLSGGKPAGMRAKAGKGLFGLGSKSGGKKFGKGGRSLTGFGRAGAAKGKGFKSGKGSSRAGSAKGRAGLGRSGKSPLAGLGAKARGSRGAKAGSLLGGLKSKRGRGAKPGRRSIGKSSGAGGGWTKLAGGLGSRLGSLAKGSKAAGSASTRLGRAAKAARIGATAGAAGGWRSLSKAAKATGKHAATWWKGASKTSRPPLMAQKERVAEGVQRPDEQQIAPVVLQAPDPISKTGQNPGGIAQSGAFTTGGSSMSFRLAEVSGEFHSAAVSYQPENMVQFQRDLNRVPELLGNIAQGIKVFAANADGQTPTGKAVIAQLQGIYELLLNASNAAAELNPAFRRAHETDLHRLTNPRTNERMWDVTANSH